MKDALFLDTHPGWSYRDLMDAPEDVIDLLRRLDAARARK